MRIFAMAVGGVSLCVLNKLYVDNLSNPLNISYIKIQTINLLKSNNGKINNITALVGSNGAGKTTLLSFIASNYCIPKLDRGSGYERDDNFQYQHNKSIYVFIENQNLIIYHNLENELNCDFHISSDNLYWNKREEDRIEPLYNIRQQLIIYLSNSSFVPESLLGYSRSDKTYNINLHQKSMSLVASHFYKSLFGKIGNDDIREIDDGFAWVIKENRDDRKFQELLDIQYYYYLLEYKIGDYGGFFKREIYIYFESIISLIKNKYNDDNASDLIRNYYKKIDYFKKYYKFKEIEDARRKNCIVVLYVNLLFEIFSDEEKFKLPAIDFNKNLYEQISKLPLSDKYKSYLEDIKIIDDILSPCPMYKNTIDNPDDLACSWAKVVSKHKNAFYSHMREMFKERRSYVLRYIRIKNLDMSSGERAMQNMFSWLVLMPELDTIMGVESSNYTSKLLLVDEIDLYSHPEWQKK